MKTILKKNQIIITALAIMIAVVGYLNFTKDKGGEKDMEEALSTAGKQALSENEYADISAEDLGEDYYFSYEVSDNGELILKENEQTGGSFAVNDTTPKDGNKPGDSSKPEDGKDASQGDASKEQDSSGQIPDEKEEDGKKTGDTSQETNGESTPGEAVFTSVTIQSGYFANAKLNREQMRARNKETLMEVVADDSVSDEMKQNAIDEIIALTARAECENAAELLLEAKGYEGVVVSMSEKEVDVVVNALSITEQQIAQIEDIVNRKTGISADGIVITTVVTEE